MNSYQNALVNIPAPGCGCHSYLLTVSNYGFIAKMTGDQIFSDIRRHIPSGSRRIADKEINEAISKAKKDHDGGTFIPRPRPTPIVKDGKATLQKIINQAKITNEVDLWEASPIRLWEAP